jgi:hypothetical protein
MALTRMQVLTTAGPFSPPDPSPPRSCRRPPSATAPTPTSSCSCANSPRQFATPRDIWPYLPDLPVGG